MLEGMTDANDQLQCSICARRYGDARGLCDTLLSPQKDLDYTPATLRRAAGHSLYARSAMLGIFVDDSLLTDCRSAVGAGVSHHQCR